MTANAIYLRQSRNAAPDNPPELATFLTQLVGEPFRFARVSYGDELTLHFGDLRHARSAKLGKKLYGAYILGVRGSPWILKSGAEPLVVSAGIHLEDLPSGVGKPLSKEELEASPLIEPESRVLSATPFVVKPNGGFGLELRVSDGSTILILPTAPEHGPEGDVTPEITVADWELSSPLGLLKRWSGAELVVHRIRRWRVRLTRGPFVPIC